MARSIDSINIRRHAAPSLPNRNASEPPRVRPVQTGSGGLAFAAILIGGAVFLATRPTADQAVPTEVPVAVSETSTVAATDGSARPGPPQPEQGESLEHAVILDRPLATSKTQDGTAGTANATEAEPIVAPKPDSFTTRILNGSGQTGAAATTREQLTNLGFQIIDAGTAVNAYPTSVIYYRVGYELQAKVLQSAFGQSDTSVEQNQIASPADVLLVIGASAVGS